MTLGGALAELSIPGLFGPVFGAVTFVFIEEVLSSFTTYWALPFGVLLVLSVLFIKGGMNGLIQRGWSRD